MEYCGGQSMQDIYLYTRRPLEEDCIAFVSRETLQGLNFMHNRGRIHRDIKGANILLTDDGHVKVADFGVAAQLNTSIAKRTTLIGTPYWMAPEVASIESRGSGYDGKCDIWGVGITAIEYAELQPPMFDLDPRKALQILGSRNYKPPSLQDRHKWSPLFHSFIKCCLIKAERRRPDAATMLTHNFVTNPHLSTLLTQRLLCYRRQLESSVKNTYSHGDTGISSSNKKNPPSGGNFIPPDNHEPPVSFPGMPISVRQEEYFKSLRVNDLPVSHGIDASVPVHFVPSQQLIIEREPERFPSVQIQSSLSCSDLADDHTKNCNEIAESTDVNYISQGREITINNNDNLTKKNYTPDITVTVNGFVKHSQSDSSSQYNNTQQQAVIRPLLPAKSSRHSSVLNNDSNHSVDSTNSFNQNNNMATLISIGSTDNNSNINSNSDKSSAITITTNNNDKQKPSRPCPPIVRLNPSRVSNINSVGEISEETDCLTENHLFADRLLHISSEDLLSEVMDAFEKRRSGVDFRASQSIDGFDVSRIDNKIKLNMGACFMQIFEGCPLKVNSTATWVNPETLSQIILFGTNDGIYYLDLVNLADGTLELLVPRRCLWLFVFKDTMMSISGQHPQLFSHNLISLMKSRTSQTRFLHKRFQPTVKVPDTRGCYIATVVRNQFKGMKYLCGAIDKSILVMEWYNPRNTFIEVKRVEVPCMPNPLLNFDLIINPNQTLPTVCLGVSSTPDPLVYKLHLVNLNENSNSSWYTNPCRFEDQLQVIKVVQLDTRSLLICFPTHATMVNMNGRVLVSRDGRIAKFPFDTTVDSIVRLHDSVLAFHTHGLRGIDFFGRVTQDIDDDKHVYRLLGSDRNIVVESRPSDNPMSNSNLLILVGHEDSS
ncbi:unnamed protein product [Schistosoma guineensis]|nr:unnamed protein product [Schistosoma guineensis]